jgi:hypothetical protein
LGLLYLLLTIIEEEIVAGKDLHQRTIFAEEVCGCATL